MFTLDDLDAGGEQFVKELEEDLKFECGKIGHVLRVKVYENNPEGFVQVKFKDITAAEECLKVMNGRFFDGRQLECFYWDGETDFNKKGETKEMEDKRIQDFGKFLEQE